ncbi:MAG: PKD domain-containing protein [Halobacteria archaeon]
MDDWREIDWSLVFTVLMGALVLVGAGGIQVYLLSEITTGDSADQAGVMTESTEESIDSTFQKHNLRNGSDENLTSVSSEATSNGSGQKPKIKDREKSNGNGKDPGESETLSPSGKKLGDIDKDRLAEIKVSETEVKNGTPINFSIKSNSGLGHFINNSYWDFGDGYTDKGWTANHLYKEPGNYTVELRVFDNRGGSDTDKVNIKVTKVINETRIMNAALWNKSAVIKHEPLKGRFDKKKLKFSIKDQTKLQNKIEEAKWLIDGEKKGKGFHFEPRFSAGTHNVTLKSRIRVNQGHSEYRYDTVYVDVSKYRSRGVQDVYRKPSEYVDK